MKRLYIVDGQTSVCQMLAEILGQRDYEVVGSTGDKDVAVTEIYELNPELIIMESRLPGMPGAELLKILKKKNPEFRFIVFSDNRDPSQVRELLSSGAHGFVEKSADLGVLMSSIKIVAEGGCYFGFNISDVIRSAVAEPKSSSAAADGLTDREREVLRLIALGNSNKDIAARLELSVKTVDNHRCSMMRKLDVHNVASITRYAMEHRLIEVNFVD